MNKTDLIAKISIKYVLPTCIWKYFWRISQDFAEIPEFRGSATARNIRSPEKGSKRLYAIRALKKCRLTDRQLILVYCSIIRSVLEYASPAWAGLTQYLSDQIESIQKRALKIIFPSLCYEDALKKSGLILLCQRR